VIDTRLCFVSTCRRPDSGGAKEFVVRIQRVLRTLVLAAGAMLAGESARAQSVTQLHVSPACSQSVHVDVTIDLASSAQPVAGGQFFLSYDTTRLQYVGADPSVSFPTVVYSASDMLAGTIDYAVAVDFGATTVAAPARFATLHFNALTEICAGDHLTLVSFRSRPSPLPPTRLTDLDGTPITTTTADLGAFTVDHTAPTITTPLPVAVSTNSFDCFASVPLSPPATSDNCGPVGVVGTRSDSLPLSSPYPLGPTTVTWTATDCAGNSSSTNQLVTVTDDTAPVISSCGSNQSAVAGPGCQAAVPDFTGGVAATDNCTAPGSLVITQSPPAGMLVGLGPTTVVVTVRDASGNPTTCPRTFTVLSDLSPPTSVSANPTSVCQGVAGTVTLSASGGTGAILRWFDDSCGGHSIGTGSPLVVPAPSVTTTYYVRRESDCGGSSCLSVQVTVVPGPTASASAAGGSDIICPTGIVQLNGSATNYLSVHWSGGDGVFSNPNILNPTYSPGPMDIAAGTVVLTLTASPNAPCAQPAVAHVTITINPLPVAPSSANSSANNYCSGTVSSISLTASGGSGAILIWSQGSCTGPSIGTGTPLVIPAPTSTTTYFAHWVNSCGPSACAAVTVTVVQPPTANAGSNQTICANGVASLSGSATGFLSAHWTGGDGSFTNANSLTTVYTPGPADIAAGSVVLTLTATPNAPCATPAVSHVTITILALPVAPSSASSNPPAVCAGVVPTITLSAVGGSGLQLDWYAGSCGGSSIGSGTPLTIPAPATTTTYFARWTNKCGSSSCASVLVTVVQPTVTPTGIGSSADAYCSGSVSSITLTVQGGSGATAEWFTGGCGTTPIGTGNSIIIPAPTVSTTYYVRWTRPPCAASACFSRTIIVNPITGACCTGYGVGKTCTAVDPASCAGPTTPTHAYRGDCTVCMPSSCCSADYNNNGVLEIVDIFTFINDWFLGVRATDFTNSNDLQVEDIFKFLNAWFAGC
jgi:hypothetical protein